MFLFLTHRMALDGESGVNANAGGGQKKRKRILKSCKEISFFFSNHLFGVVSPDIFSSVLETTISLSEREVILSFRQQNFQSKKGIQISHQRAHPLRLIPQCLIDAVSHCEKQGSMQKHLFNTRDEAGPPCHMIQLLL